MEIGKLSATITADDRDYQAKMKAADRLGAQTASSIKKSFSNLSPKINTSGITSAFSQIKSIAGGNLISGAISTAFSAIGGAMKDALSAGIEYNKMLETGAVRLERFFKTSQQAKEFVGIVEKFAIESPIFELPQALTGAQRLLQMKFAAKDVPKMLSDIGDAVGGVGGNAETIDRVTLALSQMVGKGRLQAEEMEQLAEAGIPAWELLAKAAGKSETFMRKAVEGGTVDAKRAVQGIVAMMGDVFEGQSERQGKTLAGLQAQFEGQLNKDLGTATEGAFDELKKGYEKATIGLSTTGAKVFADEINKMLTEQAKALQPLLDKVASGEYFKQGADAANKGNEALKQLNKGNTGAAATAGAQALGRGIGLEYGAKGEDKLVDAIVGSMDSIDKKFAAPIVKGIVSALQMVGLMGNQEGQKAGAAIGDGVEAGAKERLKIQSPSQVFVEIGRNVIEGFNQGLEADKSKIKAPIDVEAMRLKLLDELRKLRDDQAVKAMLDTIAKAEGTGARYDMKFGGGRIDDLSWHPWDYVTRKMGGKDITSTAAGRYQFLGGTWERVAAKLGLSDFGPESQDLAAIQLMKERGMLGPLGRGDIAGALTAGNGEWASLPGSPYGQPTQKAATLIEAYNAALEKLTATTQTANQVYQALTVTLPQVQQSFVQLVTGKPPAIGMPRGGDGAAAKPLLSSAPLELPKAMDLTKVAAQALEIQFRNTRPPIERSGEALKEFSSKAGGFADMLDRSWKKLQEEADQQARINLSSTASFKRFQDFKEQLGKDFEDAIQGLITGSENWKSALLKITNDIFNSVIQEVMLSATRGNYGSIGGLIGGALSGLFKGFFGGGKASGGPVETGKIYPVGEKGPELFAPGASGWIIPNDQARQMGQGGGGLVVVNHFTIQAPGGQVAQQTQQQIAAKSAAAIQHAALRNN
jgi:tape measure domain-containing protein